MGDRLYSKAKENREAVEGERAARPGEPFMVRGGRCVCVHYSVCGVRSVCRLSSSERVVDADRVRDAQQEADELEYSNIEEAA